MCYRPILLKTLYHYSFTLKSPCPLSSIRTLWPNWISWVKSILWLSGSSMYPEWNLAYTKPSSEATQRPPTHQHPWWFQYIFLLLLVPNNSQLLFLGCKAKPAHKSSPELTVCRKYVPEPISLLRELTSWTLQVKGYLDWGIFSEEWMAGVLGFHYRGDSCQDPVPETVHRAEDSAGRWTGSPGFRCADTLVCEMHKEG
jgi:hypothetical protein